MFDKWFERLWLASYDWKIKKKNEINNDWHVYPATRQNSSVLLLQEGVVQRNPCSKVKHPLGNMAHVTSRFLGEVSTAHFSAVRCPLSAFVHGNYSWPDSALKDLRPVVKQLHPISDKQLPFLVPTECLSFKWHFLLQIILWSGHYSLKVIKLKSREMIKCLSSRSGTLLMPSFSHCSLLPLFLSLFPKTHLQIQDLYLLRLVVFCTRTSAICVCYKWNLTLAVFLSCLTQSPS